MINKNWHKQNSIVVQIMFQFYQQKQSQNIPSAFFHFGKISKVIFIQGYSVLWPQMLSKRREGGEEGLFIPLNTFTQFLLGQASENTKLLMIKVSSVILAIVLVAAVTGSRGSPCPVANHPGNIHTGRIIAALQSGIIPLSEEEDSQCYTYNLPYSFQKAPEVAVGVHDFEAQKSTSIFFYIKPIFSTSLSSIPFVIRTQWAYTSWTQISFSFIAEDRNDLQSGYYQIDSGSLSGCENGKQINVLLPAKNLFNPSKQINYHLFLHGFEISTIQMHSGSRSPFQIQIGDSSANVSGITVMLSVTTATKVDSIFVSYISYQETTLEIIAGSHLFDKTYGGVFSHTPAQTVPVNYARLFGITGFIVNYNAQRIVFGTSWNGFSFDFHFGSSLDEQLVQYFLYSYIFFYGSECKDCLGFTLSNNGTCVSFCPVGTYRTPQNTCLSCGEGKEWNGTECIKSCPSGQYLSATTNQCECPPSLNWNGDSCISCSNGKIWNAIIKQCECPRPLRWNGFTCAKVPQCDGGKVWDVYTYSCKCPEYQYLSGNLCKDIPACTGGQILTSSYRCICPTNYIWDGSSCIYTPCFGGQIWTGSNCVCRAGQNFNGKMCIQCINGQVWDKDKMSCECQGGYKWNGQYCERTYECSGNRVWNSTYEQCICPTRFYWSGYACLPIPSCPGGQRWSRSSQKCLCSSSSNFNGTNCVRCSGGKIWSQTTLTCSCPPGTIQDRNSSSCFYQQQCTGSKVWVQNTLSCECPPSTVWNGNFCIVNPCSNGRVWNDKFKSCECPGGKVWMKQSCLPPMISCNNGRIWNPAIYACECPPGTYPNHQKCDPVPVCRNGKVYNPLNNQCNCPYGLVEKLGQCADPDCPQGHYWNGWECQIINCPPPSYFHINRCVYGGTNGCPFGHVWDGEKCILYPISCPKGTSWSNNNCASNQCQNGNYLNSQGDCVPFSMQCPLPAVWNGNKCQTPSRGCPPNTFLQGDRCMPFVKCQNKFVWDPAYLRCVCPPGMINNGNECIECPASKIWTPSQGCICPEGSFDVGATCETIQQNRCSLIHNSIWEEQKCKCRPGFTKVDLQCVCYGTQTGNLCDKCSYKPNSQLNHILGECHCKSGFTEINGHCVPNGSNVGNDDPNKCSVGTYFDRNHKMCLACSNGCLTCSDCYTCRVCAPGFIYNPSTSTCFQLCGDGIKFIHECDDGNNRDGDGCSRDCKVQSTYRCTGGSPDQPDQCFHDIPDRVTIQQTGQIRKSTSIVLNVKVNYIPNSLLLSQECANQCRQILVGNIISGDVSATSITSQFILGTSYSFSINIQFGRPYIGKFDIKIGFNNQLTSKFFGLIPIDQLTIEVKPQYLAAIQDEDIL